MTAPLVPAGDQLCAAVQSTLNISNNAAFSPSGSSSDTLHKNDAFNDERKFANVSHLSTVALNFEDLNLQDEASPQQREYVDQFSSPRYSKARCHHSPAFAHTQPAPQFYRNSHHHHTPSHRYAGGGDNQRNTHVWISDEARAAQEFLVIRNSMKRQFKNSEVAKWKVADYIAHREAGIMSRAKMLAERAESKEFEIEFRVPPISPPTQDMMRRCGLQGNFEQISNHGRALGAKTIWCKDWKNGKDDIAPWPCMAELKWEGDDRAKTGVGRYPPLPREQGPPTIPWNQLQTIEQYPIDQIARIPTMEDVYLPVDEIDDEFKYDLLNKNLEEAMDAYLES